MEQTGSAPHHACNPAPSLAAAAPGRGRQCHLARYGEGSPGLGGNGAAGSGAGVAGGGGGWYGGGGGLNSAGGGGGSGYGPTGTSFETGVHSGDGQVTITYTVNPPAAAGPTGLRAAALKKCKKYRKGTPNARSASRRHTSGRSELIAGESRAG